MTQQPAREHDTDRLRRDLSKAIERAGAAEAKAVAAEARLRNQSMLLAEAEHKLKTRVALIGGWVDLLADTWDAVSSEDRQRGIESIRTHTRGLAHDAERLLEELQAEIAATELKPEVLPLAPVLAVSQRDWHTGGKHTIVTDCEPDVTIFADPSSLAQVLGHLIENAVKYSPNGGSIVVTGRRVPYCDGSRQGMVEVEVRDHGVGLPDEVDVFAPFQRGPQTAGLVSGSGIGLYIVRNLVEAMGGQIDAVNAAGGGSSFLVLLPATPPVV